MPKPSSATKPRGSKSALSSSSKNSHRYGVERAALTGLRASARVLRKLDVPEVFHTHLKAAIAALEKHLRRPAGRKPGGRK